MPILKEPHQNMSKKTKLFDQYTEVFYSSTETYSIIIWINAKQSYVKQISLLTWIFIGTLIVCYGHKKPMHIDIHLVLPRCAKCM